MVKQSLKKQPTLERGAEQKPPTLLEKIIPFPPKSYNVIGKSLGNSVVEMAPPNGTNNQPRERIKTS